MLAELLTKTISTKTFRIAVAMTAAFLLAAATIVGVLFWQTNQLLTDTVMRSLRSEARDLAREAATGSIDDLAEKIKIRSLEGALNLYSFSKRSGEPLAGNLAALPAHLALSPQGGVFRYDGSSGRRMAVAIPVPVGPSHILYVGRDIEEQRGFVARVQTMFLWGFGFLSLAAIAAGMWAGRAVLGRIDSITATSQSIMIGDLSRRVPITPANDELDHLAASLNAMLDRIEQLMHGLKEVSDNIAHDLKTPLNRLRNRAEEALRDKRGPEAYREGLESTIEKADDLIKTFNALLLIARLEAGVVQETAETFDLGALVRDVAELYEPLAEEQGLVLTIAVADGLAIEANRQLIGQAVANLADNAIKYASTSAESGKRPTIDIQAHSKGANIEVVVADHGPGIAEGDRERALRRFVRLEKSRTRPGTGLGLSLVVAVAHLHGGTIRLEDNAPGLRVVLSLPR